MTTHFRCTFILLNMMESAGATKTKTKDERKASQKERTKKEEEVRI